MNTKELAAKAVDAYSQAVGGYAVNGQKIPAFTEMSNRVQAAWLAAIEAVISEISDISYNNGYVEGLAAAKEG